MTSLYVTVMQRFEAAYVKCVKMFFYYARLDSVTSMFFIWVFLQLAVSFTMPGIDLLPAFRIIITQLLDLFMLFVLFNVWPMFSLVFYVLLYGLKWSEINNNNYYY